MKKFIPTLLLVMFSSILMGQSVTVVLSQNKCHSNKISELRKMMEENGADILDDLVEQGKLINWGVLTHAWGDVYNWNVFYVAESHVKFLEAWNEFISKVMEVDPEAADKIGEICWEHKDSIYTQIMGSGMKASSE
jgi:hypothetical protein